MDSEKDREEEYMNRLLEEDRSSWPGTWRRLGRSGREELSPDEADALTRTTINAFRNRETHLSELEKKELKRAGLLRSGKFVYFLPVIAAGILVALLLPRFHPLTKKINAPEPGKIAPRPSSFIVFTRGKNAVLRSGQRFRAIRGSALTSGDILSVSSGGNLVFTWGARVTHEIRGPGLLEIVKNNIKNKETQKNILSLRLHKGELAVLSENTAKKPQYVWQAENLRFVPTGTFARLKYFKRFMKLDVLEGGMKVQRPGSEQGPIIRGASLYIYFSVFKSGALPKSRALFAGEEQELNSRKKYLQDLRKRFSSPDESGEKKETFRTEDEIRRRYGSLQEVHLKNGKRLRGYYFSRGGRLFIQTVQGLYPLRREDIIRALEL